MFQKIIIAIALVGAGQLASAAESQQRGVYLGAGLGVTALDDDGALSGSGLDDSDKNLMLFGGYKFFKHLAVEGRYNDLGTYTVPGFGLDISSVSAHAIGIIPFGQSGWEIFGQLGVGRLTIDASGVDSDSWDAASAGAGVRYSITENFSLAVQTDVYVWEEEDFSDTYDFNIGIHSLTVRLMF